MPSTDTLVQDAGTSARRLPIDADEIGHDPEYGDQKFHARDADSSDHSMHHFLAPNDGRGGLTSTVDEDQGSAMRRSPALAKEDRVCSDGLWSGMKCRSNEECATLYKSLSGWAAVVCRMHGGGDQRCAVRTVDWFLARRPSACGAPYRAWWAD